MSEIHWEGRLPTGGRIDRNRPVSFEFDGRRYGGFGGDTLASALIANSIRVVSRGIKSGRPRGVLGSGSEEPNALVRVVTNAGTEPMLRATEVELVDGLQAFGLRGLGRLDPGPDAARFDKTFAHAEVVVVGGGPAGIETALAAGRRGERAILLDDGPTIGGSLLAAPAGEMVSGVQVDDWLRSAQIDLASFANVRVLSRTTALGVYDHGLLIAAQRLTGYPDAPTHPGATEGRLWHIRAGRIVLATGAIERPIPFAGNDRPGVMLASAVRSYINRWAVRPGRRAVVFTTNDEGLACVDALERAGIEIAAIADTRRGDAVDGTTSDPDGQLAGALISRPAPRAGMPRVSTLVECDLLAVSGGRDPSVALWTHAGGSLRWRSDISAFVPDRAGGPLEAVGAANGGGLPIGDAPWQIAQSAMQRASVDGPLKSSFTPAGADVYLDLARDATLADVELAVQSGLTSMEHVKRFTTIGTGSDQGRTSGVIVAGILAGLTGGSIGGMGLTRARPPAVSVSFGMLAGRRRGNLFDPTRTTPIHSWHAAHGAEFENVGQWQRPRFYPRTGETMDDAVRRECTAARSAVAAIDVSTLGKIDLQGPDSGEFLDRVYTNTMSNLQEGSCRYGVMCGLDGMVFDDGVVSRLGPTRFHLTTTTGNATAVLDHLEEWLQTEWPNLRVRCTAVTEQWSTVALVGPAARALLSSLASDLDVSAAAFPFMTWQDARIGDVAARICRISFSGELAYEVNIAGRHGLAIWERIVDQGRPFGLTPYGTETLHVLRAEKGYPIIGQDTDGTVTPGDLGMDWIVSKHKPFIGKRSLQRPDSLRADRRHLVALLPLKPDERVPEGAQLVNADASLASPPVLMEGHVTSSYWSPVLGRSFALGLIKRGRERYGETLLAPLGDRTVPMTIRPAKLYDPEDLRRDG